MKKSLILLPLVALVVAGLFLVPISAHMAEPSPGFGSHVASMTLGHMGMHQGIEFGHMVSGMAQGMSCH